MIKRKYATATFFPSALQPDMVRLMVPDRADMRRLALRMLRCSEVLATERAKIAAMSPKQRQATAAEIAAALEEIENMKFVATEAAERVRLA